MFPDNWLKKHRLFPLYWFPYQDFLAEAGERGLNPLRWELGNSGAHPFLPPIRDVLEVFPFVSMLNQLEAAAFVQHARRSENPHQTHTDEWRRTARIPSLNA